MLTAEDEAALKTQITANEARKPYLYDDATGARIMKGSQVIGHPTWGIGYNADAVPFCDAAIDAQYAFVMDRLYRELATVLPWTETLPSGPFRAIVDVAYNAGVTGLLKFHKMLAFAQAGQYGPASLELIHSQLEPHRARRLAALMNS